MQELKRVVTLRDAVMINLGAIIGAGIFVIIGLAAYYSGPALPIAILISGIIAMFTGLSFSYLTKYSGKEGGVYEYVKDSFNRYAGFIAGILWVASNLIAIAAVATSFVTYFYLLFGGHGSILVSILIILFFALINILGIKSSSLTTTVLVIINVLTLVVFSISSLFYFNTNNFNNMLNIPINNIIYGAAIIFFAYTGFSRVTTIGDEVINPEKTIPLAIIISILISIVIYASVSIAAIGLISPKELASSAAPLETAINKIGNPLLSIIIAIGGITATAGVLLTGILGSSRVLYAMGRDNELPKWLSYLDRFSTPKNAIAIATIISLLFLVFVSFNNIVESTNLAILLAYLLINVSAFYVSIKEKRASYSINSILGMITIIIVISTLNLESFEIVSIILLISISYLIIREKLGKKVKEVESHSLVREFKINK